MFVVNSSARSYPNCSSGTAMSADFFSRASSDIFSSVWISTDSFAREALAKSCSGSLLRSECISFINCDQSSSAAAIFFINSFSSLVKSSTGFFARFSVASMRFFCMAEEFFEFLPGFFELVARVLGKLGAPPLLQLDRRLRLGQPRRVEELPQRGDDPVLHAGQFADRLAEGVGGGQPQQGVASLHGVEHVAEGQLVHCPLHREPLRVAADDRLDQLDGSLVNRHLFAADVARRGRLLRHGRRAEDRRGDRAGVKLLLQHLPDRVPLRVQDVHRRRRFVLFGDDSHGMPGARRLLRAEVEPPAGKVAAVEGNAAKHDRLARLELIRAESTFCRSTAAVTAVAPLGVHVFTTTIERGRRRRRRSPRCEAFISNRTCPEAVVVAGANGRVDGRRRARPCRRGRA